MSTRPVTIHGVTRQIAVEVLRGRDGLLATKNRVALLDDFGTAIAARLVLSADPTPRIVGVMTLDGPETLAQFVFPILGFTKNAA